MATQAGEIFCFRREINFRTLRELIKGRIEIIYKKYKLECRREIRNLNTCLKMRNHID